MLLGHNQTSVYCVGRGTSLVCPPIKIPQLDGLYRNSSSSNFTDELQPPVARKIPYNNTYHGNTSTDEYHWLRDDKREDFEVLDHLKAENRYSESLLFPIKSLEAEIYNEIVARLVEDDETYPKMKGGYGYYKKTVKDLQYPIHCRKHIDKDSLAKEEVVLDLNKFQKALLGLAQVEISPNQMLLAYTLDTTGDEAYSLFVKHLEQGIVSEEAKEMAGEVVWSNDGQHLYYTTNDAIHRSYRLFRHRLGNQQLSDELLYEEKDQKFYIGLKRSISQKYLFIKLGKSTASEVHYLDLDNSTSTLKLFSAREEDRIYRLEHQGSSFIVLTNRYMDKKYSNFHVLRSPISQESSEKEWTEVIPYDETHYITNFYPLEDYIVLEERFGGYTQLRVIETNSNSPPKDTGYLIEFPEPIFTVYARPAYLHYSSAELFFEYSSFTTPRSLFIYNLATRSSTLLKTDPVSRNFTSKSYVTERVVAPNNVPISLVYRKDLFRKNGSNPLHLCGYGSYGIPIDPSFNSPIISLLDRGFVYAIAHVRGGSEMGRQWYEAEGKLLKKKNTFRDFSNAARYLISKNYTSSKHLSIEGASAGGLLIGAAINLNPGLFNAAILGVPFVDVINTMMDSTLPLTIGEYEEWGNPNKKKFFEYMMSYSPYDNLPKTGEGLPHLLVRSGLNDPRVGYWEPAKYVARLRAILAEPPNRKRIVQLINMGAGHVGLFGRYHQYQALAQNLAFLVATAEKRTPFL